MSAQQIADDLGRKISERLEELIQREVDLAGHVLPPAEQLIMLLKIARGMSIAAILVGLQRLNDGADPSVFFDTLRTQLDLMIGASKDEALAVLPMVAAGNVRDARRYVRGER